MSLTYPIGFFKKDSSYAVENALLLDSTQSSFLSRTPSAASNRKTWTFSTWIKRGKLDIESRLITSDDSGAPFLQTSFRLVSDNTIKLYSDASGTVVNLNSTAVYRDVNSWYHIMVAFDTTQAIASDRVNIFVNGNKITDFITETYPDLNTDHYINSTRDIFLNASTSGIQHIDGLVAETYFIDGVALQADSFGAFDSITNQWKPIVYKGTYGTNGFYLPFTNNTTNNHFNTVLYSGNTTSQSIGNLGFQPDLVWIKGRSGVEHNEIYDSVRGATKFIATNLSNTETTEAGGVTSFDQDGFSVGNRSGVNGSNNFVAWCWEAPLSNSGTTTGSGTLKAFTEKYNSDLGFSIIGYEGNGTAGHQIPHSLGAAPDFIMIKNRDNTQNWSVYHSALGNTKSLQLDTNNAPNTHVNFWNNTSPTSTEFTLGIGGEANQNTNNHVAYAFTEKAGFSKFGSYAGNGSSNGPDINCGFTAGFVIIRRIDSGGYDWILFDAKRDTNYNWTHLLSPNNTNAENPNASVLTNTENGFKLIQPGATINDVGGTYIYIAFADTSVVGDISQDLSGQGNNFLPQNITYDDQVSDSPTNNFGTWNPLFKPVARTFTYTNGNLTVSPNGDSAGIQISFGSFGMSTGKWYSEFAVENQGSGIMHSSLRIGISKNPSYYQNTSNYLGSQTGDYAINGEAAATYANGTYIVISSPPTSTTFGDIFQVAVDMDAGKIWFGFNGTWLDGGNPVAGTGEQYSGLTGTFYFAAENYGDPAAVYADTAWIANFGQKAFSYTPPSGFESLSTNNLSNPEIKQPKDYVNSITYTGDGLNGHAITGLNFQPDLVWIKSRSSGLHHNVHDSVRGADKHLTTTQTAPESDFGTSIFVESFDTNGFTVSSNSGTNSNGSTFVGWNWKESPLVGMDIVLYTGDGVAGKTVAHNLGVPPEMMIIKNRTAIDSWAVYHKDVPNTQFLKLNTRDAATTNNTWNNTSPDASNFTIGNTAITNSSGNNFVAYLFASILGYSKIGSYIGNGSTDGPFVDCGFRPAYVMIKNISAAGDPNDWEIHDNARDPYNEVNDRIWANLTNAESSAEPLDFVSNGFKIRSIGGAKNINSNTYIYIAFAESPFKYSNAR